MRKSRAFKLLANVCRLILACTFIVSGFTKVIDPWGTAMKVNEYLSIYGMESLQGASMAFSIWLCGAEMMMGCMLLFKVRIRLISIFAVLSMLFFTALTLLSATVIPVEDCGCFGEALKLTPWQTFYKNLALLPMALVVWWRYRPDKIFAFNPLEIVLTVTFFFLTMYLGYYCYRHLPLIDFLPYKVGVNIWEGMHAPVVVELDFEAGRRQRQERQAAFGHGELHLGRHRVHDADDGLPGLHAFVIVDELAFHDAGERRTELGLLEQAEGVLIGGLDLCVTGLGAFELLAGYGFVLQQPLHTLHLRTGLLESRPVGRNL